tara:strand:+ start:771 stop:1085 length:315 start_codon:yes stop_codon:yes gene_type:complete
MKWLKNSYNWIANRIKHKLGHLSWDFIKGKLKKHGLAFVVILVGWEILEDVVFPLIFTWLGLNVHPAFLAGAPVSWIVCLHPIAVPIIWAVWIKIKDSDKNLSK